IQIQKYCQRMQKKQVLKLLVLEDLTFQHIIYLVWKVRSSSTNNFSTCFFCILWQYFWIWICHRKNNRIFIHFLYHFGCQRSANRYADKDICSFDYFL